jgi:hypothetical protein
MCAQCMATAATAAGAVSGLRSWLGVQSFAWLTPTRLKGITVVMVGLAVLVSATVSGTGS